MSELPSMPPFRGMAVTGGELTEVTTPGDTFDSTWLSELEHVGFALQIREKRLSDGDLFRLVCTTRSAFSGTLLVNGRADIASAAGADGVHLPGSGLPVDSVRSAFPELLVGVSTHSTHEARQAQQAGAHFVLFGPVFDTPSKRGYGPPQGLQRLARACSVGVPVLAIGGVSVSRVPTLRSAGAHGVAGIRSFSTAADLRQWDRAFVVEPTPGRPTGLI